MTLTKVFNNLSEAIQEIQNTYFTRENIARGIKCPCCSREQKLYKIVLTKAMAKGLMHLSKDFKLGDDFHLTDYFFNLKHPEIKSAADASIYKLALWGLIAPVESKKGYYTYTAKAVNFLTGSIMLPEYIETYNNDIKGESRNSVTLKGALKTDFNYAKLMGWE